MSNIFYNLTKFYSPINFNIMCTTPQPKGNIRFPYGKYKGKLVSDIIISDAQYVAWAIKQGIVKLPKLNVL